MDYPQLRKLVLQRDQYKCVLCKQDGDRVIHMISPVLGGDSSIDNLITVCDECSINVVKKGAVFVNVPISNEVYEKFKHFCAMVGRSESDVIRQVISEFVWSDVIEIKQYDTFDKRIKVRMNLCIYEMLQNKIGQYTIKDVVSSIIDKYIIKFKFNKEVGYG